MAKDPASSVKPVKNSPLQTGLLAYEKSIEPSEAVFYSITIRGEEREVSPIEVQIPGVTGQTSSRKVSDPTKYGKTNPQFVETARMPPEAQLLQLDFKIRILNNALAPCKTDSGAVYRAFKKLTAHYVARGGMRFLAALYLENLANGRFMARNRRMMDVGHVTITPENIDPVTFDCYAFDLERPGGMDALTKGLAQGSTKEQLDALVDLFERALCEKPEGFRVTFTGELAGGFEVRPSQLYARPDYFQVDEAYKHMRGSKSEPSRFLARRPMIDPRNGQTVLGAVMSAQKIGAMIRTIDMWYAQDASPVPVNPYAGSQVTGEALRFRDNKDPSMSKRDFYAIGDDYDNLVADVINAQSAEQMSGDTHFFFANLIRGGVFG